MESLLSSDTLVETVEAFEVQSAQHLCRDSIVYRGVKAVDNGNNVGASFFLPGVITVGENFCVSVYHIGLRG